MKMTIMDMWPILSFLTLQTVAAVWWAATTTQRVVQLEKEAAKHSGHGESIAEFKAAVDHLTKRIEELLAEFKTVPRARK